MTYAASALMGLAVLFVWGCQQGPKNGSTDNIDAFMVSLSAEAVERAKSGYGVKLDYTADSVKEVEKLLAMKYDMTKAHPMTEEETSGRGSHLGSLHRRGYQAAAPRPLGERLLRWREGRPPNRVQ